MTSLISLLYLVTSFLAGVFGFMELRLIFRFLRHRRSIGRKKENSGQAARPDRELPQVVIQIPLYNERTLAERVIRAAAMQDYPRHLLTIQILDDSNDETSA